VAEQVLDRVEDRAGMGFDGDAILRPEHVEVERCHQGGDGGAGGLVASDLEPVAFGADVVRVVDGPGGEPQDLALQLPQEVQAPLRASHPRHPIARIGQDAAQNIAFCT